MNNVHFEEAKKINPEITSKEAIMLVCRRIAAEKGLKALSMRAVARECGIALGTLYNYFSNKEELLIAAIASVWEDIFRLTHGEETSPPLPFPEYVEKLFINVRERFREYPDFFTAHSAAVASSGKGKAKNEMENCTEKIKATLLSVLHKDKLVNQKVFGAGLSEEGFVEFVLDSIILLLMQQKECDTLIAVIRKVIYNEALYAGNF